MGQIVNPAEAAARARAAITYANIRHADLAGQIGMNIEVLRRLVSPTKPRGASVDELWRIADATGVPRDFMLDGFDVFDPDTPAARMRHAWQEVFTMLERLTESQHELAEQVLRLTSRIEQLELRAAEQPLPLPDPVPPRPPATGVASPRSRGRRAGRRRAAEGG